MVATECECRETDEFGKAQHLRNTLGERWGNGGKWLIGHHLSLVRNRPSNEIGGGYLSWSTFGVETHLRTI